MRNMKKLISLVLALCMVALCTVASAATITINPGTNATGTVSTEYHYYELLKASINGTAVSYYLDSPTSDTLKVLLDAVTVDGNDLFTFTQSADGSRWNVTINKKADGTDYTNDDGAAIAEALNTAAIKAEAVADDDFAYDSTSGKAEATNLGDGYYLVTSSLGTNLVLQTIGSVSINTKNDYFTDVKTASKTNMEVGDTVTYTITIAIPESVAAGDVITVHDTLDEHLAIDAATIAAVIGGTETAVELSDHTPAVSGETFAKDFTVTSAMLGGSVVITYDAELLSTAADDTGYVNTTYANDSSYQTLPSQVKVYTFDIDLDKTFTGVAKTDTNAANFSATFQLRTAAGDASTAIEFVGSTADGYTKADTDDTNKTTSLVVTAAAAINVKGLKAGTYYLVETATAEGYNQLTTPITVTITDTTTGDQPNITPSHTVQYSFGETTGTGTIEVTNNTGTTLPSTGGIGTTIFYILGGLLVVGAAVILVARRKAQD